MIFLSKRERNKDSLLSQIITNAELVGSDLMRLMRMFICFDLIILLPGIYTKGIIPKKKHANAHKEDHNCLPDNI